jgi:hypothetical protein
MAGRLCCEGLAAYLGAIKVDSRVDALPCRQSHRPAMDRDTRHHSSPHVAWWFRDSLPVTAVLHRSTMIADIVSCKLYEA